ncbi:MAG: hypothetical protein DCC71_08990 [Proteobacteria bacterium]|nr:MAG: hypothetical protein DCC71_08990 [Pseudomonadota bacterium]
MRDWIAPVEAAYELGPSLDGWFARLVEATRPLLDTPALAGYVLSGPAWAPQVAVAGQSGVSPAFMERFERLLRAGTREALSSVFAKGRPLFATLSQQLFARFPEERRAFERATGVSDCAYLIAPTGTGAIVVLGAALDGTRAVTAAERRRWTRIAAHVGAGLRLRIALESEASAGEAEAVLDPGAALLDATGPARSSRARAVLRDAVLRRESARSQGERGDPDRSLALWEGLVAGRWSLVDRVESDGQRFVVARRNDPDVGDPRGLTRRERQVAEYVGMGRSSKEIGYLLGIGAPAVSNAVQRAIEKLGLAGRADLAVFFAPDGLRARLVELELGGERLAAGAESLLAEHLLARLSASERDIARDLLRGDTAQSIAVRRESSPLTVEKQIRSIYEKLDVGSRVELAAKLAV